ncbi:MAG: elongation factor P [Thermomicrobiales bacterium]|nr:elongation factor P [Thermomicrobiales bacterium]MCO5219517.1 elongation factor P [Thermomicrobiales bacterium]MCO5224475.1 elongation factor P [Thermomicrobiales bacterium]MCO5228647.1 elongation factor P [Thermomicrobiales bacterium]
MIDTGDIRKGITLDIDGKLVKVMDFSHNKQARGSANIRMSLKDLRTGANTQMTAMAGTKFTSVRLERQHVQFLYVEGDHYNFMDTDSFDQIMLDRKTVEEAAPYMKENDVIDLLTYDGEPIDVELPTSVVLQVVQTDPGFKGDTATGGNKPAVMETGLTVNVPLFVSEGDNLKIDTRTGEYIERV